MRSERQSALDDIRHEFDPAFYARQAPLVKMRLQHFIREVVVTEPEPNGFKVDGSLLCYASVHKSQLDYILLGQRLHDHGWPVPRYIAGKNLFIPSISRDYLRKLGAICLDRERILRRDRVYIRAFADYVRDQVLGRGEHLLFFPEGGRSYDGRVGSPATGIYDAILDVAARSDRHMLVVPIALTYDAVVEAAAFPLLLRSRTMRQAWKKKAVYYVVDLGQILLHYFRARRFCGDAYIDVLPPFEARDFTNDRRGKVLLAQEVHAAHLRAVRVTPRSLLAIALPADEGGSRAETLDRLRDRIAETRGRGLPTTRSLAPLLAPEADPERVLRTLVASSGNNVVEEDGTLRVRRPAIMRYYRNTTAHHFET
jgi:glycerol-3-phosphate O-acyltransferase